MATPTAEELKNLPPADAANAQKFDTPLPPNDPASQSGARDKEGYLGPTNFSNIQKQYSPYQIEQATERRGTDIYWKQGVDINSIPREAPPTALTTPKPGTPTTGDIMNGSAAAGSKLTVEDPSFKMSGAVSAATAGYLTGIDARLDELTNTQQQLTEKKKADAEAKRGGIIDQIKDRFDTTAQQDRLKADRELFQVTQTVNTLNAVRQKLADASNALNQGLIYEESQPVRMGLLVGRSNELKKQGLAHIGALQSTAEILQGNIDLARAYADQSLQAVRADNAEQNAALDTLLNLYNDDLVDLTDEERDLIDYRKDLLAAESKRLDKDKDALLDLAQKFPYAFTKGGVTFMDTPQSAFQKMQQQISDDERTMFDLEVQKAKAAIGASNRSNTGGGGGGGGTDGVVTELYNYVAFLKGEVNPTTGKTYTEEEIRREVGAQYGDKIKRTDMLGYLESALKGDKPEPTAVEKELAGVADPTWLAAQGIATSNPEYRRYSSMSKADVLKDLQNQNTPAAKNEGGFFGNTFQRIQNFFAPGSSNSDPGGQGTPRG